MSVSAWVTRLSVHGLCRWALLVFGALAIGVSANGAGIVTPPTADPFGGGDAVLHEGHALSWNGQFVVFSSYATNLVPADNNLSADVFLWDRVAGEVVLVTRAPDGSQSNGDSGQAVISADGHWIAFASEATNLVASPDSNGSQKDVFLYNRLSRAIIRVSESLAGVQSSFSAEHPDINGNGRYVTFDAIGELVPGSGGVVRNVFRRDTWQQEMLRVSRAVDEGAPNGDSLDAQMDAGGQRIVFVSMGTNLATVDTVGKDIYLFDATNSETTLVSETAVGTGGDGISYFPAISGDGQVVAFHSRANNLVSADLPDYADVILRELSSTNFELISKSTQGVAANSDSTHPALNFAGDRVAFRSDASNLVGGDTEGFGDVLLHDRLTGSTSRLSQTASGAGDNGESSAPSISLNGGAVSFLARGNSLIAAGSSFADPLLDIAEPTAEPAAALGSAVLPSSRAVQVGNAFTVFASLVANRILSECSVQLVPQLGIELDFQLTDPPTNSPIGPLNQPFLIWPGRAQSLLLTLRSDEAFGAQELEFAMACNGAQAPVVVGLNTLLASVAAEPVADVVALVATQTNDGVVNLTSGAGAFSVASINLGAPANVLARAEAMGTTLDGLAICATDPLTGVCVAEPAEAVELFLDSGDTPTFAVFLSSAADIAFAPATTRVVVTFEDAAQIVRGRTSAAVRSAP